MGADDGAAVGEVDGYGVGDPLVYVGETVGIPEGAAVGDVVGKSVGAPGV